MYQNKNLKIFNADCMDIMKQYEDNYFDLAIIDPPYGIDKKIKVGGGMMKNYTNKTKNINWDNNIPEKNYFKELFRISKNQIIWGGNYMIKHTYITQVVF